jgi:hypothetical protein
MAANGNRKLTKITAATPSTGAHGNLRHGLYTDRALILGESQEHWGELRSGLHESLRPVGAYEEALVDKVAFCLWRNARVARAEWGAAEEELLPGNLAKRAGWVDADGAAAVDWEHRAYMTDDLAERERSAAIVAEINEVPEEFDPESYLPAHAPTLWMALCAEAGSDKPAAIERYVEREFVDWGGLLDQWREDALRITSGAVGRKQAEHLVEIVTARSVTSQISQPKFLDYQIKLDTQLRSVMRELREQQRHRLDLDRHVVAEVPGPARR